MGKIIKFGNDARSLILEGIDELEQAVISTLGPKGRTVILDNKTDHPVITKDGVSIARAINFTDRYKNIGASIVKNAAARTNREAGDGTTTTVLLTSELIKKGLELTNLGFERNDIKKAFYKAYYDILEQIPNYTKQVDSIEDIEHIATISANNDQEIGGIIREAFEAIGDDGIVSLLNSFNGKTYVKSKSGYEFPQGYIASAYSNTKENSYEGTNVSVLLFDDMISDIDTIKPILTVASTTKEKIVIMAPEYSDEVHGVIRQNVEAKVVDICCVRTPGFSKVSIQDGIDDLAALFGVTPLNKDNLDSFSPAKHYAKVGTIKITDKQTTMIDIAENQETIEAHIAKLQKKIAEMDEDESMTEKESGELKERIAKLSGGIATIYIGADSEIEFKEKKDRYEDAVNAVRAAIKEGVIPGGGATLSKIVYTLEQYDHDKTDMLSKAYDAYLEVCRIPAERIIKSSGVKNPYLVYEKVASGTGKFSGFNAKLDEYSDDMIVDGIIDPVLVIKAALKYATSIATTFITSDAVITDDTYNITAAPVDSVLDELKGF